MAPYHGLPDDADFPAFRDWVTTPWGSDAFANRHWVSQHRLLDRPDGVPLDFIGNYESLDEDWGAVLERVGLPHTVLPLRNKDPSPRKAGQVPDLSDPDLLGRLRRRYARDYELGGYDKGWRMPQ